MRDDIAWITELRDSRRGAIVALDGGDEAVRALVEALRGAGASVERWSVGATTGQDALRDLVAGLRSRYD